MKTQLSKHASFASKFLIVTGFIMYGFSVNAQSIVGTWKLTDAKETITDNATGKKQDVTAQMSEVMKMMEQKIEFHADNTYLFANKMKGASKGLEVTGTYSVAGNQLKLQQGKSNMETNAKTSSPAPKGLPPTVTITSNTANEFVIKYGSTINENGKNYAVDIVDTFTRE